MESKLTTAQTILQQLGGSRFVAMTGAKNFVGSTNTLAFSLSRNKSKANKMRVTLTPMDDYTVELFSIRGTQIKTIEMVEGVYADSLRNVFTWLTGMDTHL